MPELPEVETVRLTLIPLLSGLTITDVVVHVPRIVTDTCDQFIQNIKGKTILTLSRRGKYLIFVFNEGVMVSHLRMEGKYFIKASSEVVNKHEHVVFSLSNGTELRYHDVRKFGTMCYRDQEHYLHALPLVQLGKEPFDASLNATDLYELTRRQHRSLKAFLLDQSIITGLGNIYVDEVCYRLKIDPESSVNTLTKKEFEALILASRAVLEKAIALGGTTIRSYVSIEGVHGRFQNELDVHMQAGKPCKQCQTLIVKKKVVGRGTYFCPNCQKNKR